MRRIFAKVSAGKFVSVRKIQSTIVEWVFYGHLWIALAAAGLGWMSLAIISPVDFVGLGYIEVTVVAFLFMATLGIYTLHRLISYSRASVIPTTKRYALVSRYPNLSFGLGAASLAVAARLIWPFIPRLWLPMLVAVILTAFYLTPPFPGWRRLRDIPFLKVVWVAAAWAIMTHVLPLLMVEQYYIGACGGSFAEVNTAQIAIREAAGRFAFVLAIALLFDGRDVQLDLAHGVRTVANSYPSLLRWLVPILLLCATLLGYCNGSAWPGGTHFGLAIAAGYLLCLPIAIVTYRKKQENWYAVLVNGMLLLPPLITFVFWQYGWSPFIRY